MPVAIPTADGHAVVFDLETPMVEGSGKNLPIVLGLKSMSARNAVLEMGEGRECLTFPGPGGYKIVFEGEPTRIPLKRAMSGHLMAPLVSYKLLNKNSGVAEEKQVLHATDTPLGAPRQEKGKLSQAGDSASSKANAQ